MCSLGIEAENTAPRWKSDTPSVFKKKNVITDSKVSRDAELDTLSGWRFVDNFNVIDFRNEFLLVIVNSRFHAPIPSRSGVRNKLNLLFLQRTDTKTIFGR